MPVTQSRQHAFTFDDALATDLNQRMQAADLPISPVKVGYRLLPDYFGDDVVNVLIVLPLEYKDKKLPFDASDPMRRVGWDWIYDQFDGWMGLFLYDVDEQVAAL